MRKVCVMETLMCFLWLVLRTFPVDCVLKLRLKCPYSVTKNHDNMLFLLYGKWLCLPHVRTRPYCDSPCSISGLDVICKNGITDNEKTKTSILHRFRWQLYFNRSPQDIWQLKPASEIEPNLVKKGVFSAEHYMKCWRHNPLPNSLFHFIFHIICWDFPAN